MPSPGEAVARAKALLERARARSAFVDVVVRVFKRFGQDDGGFHAAALTYYFFFSLFPLMLFAAAILGYITFGNTELRDDLIRHGVNTVPLIRDALKPGGVEAIIENRGNIALTATLLALYAGSGAIVSMEHALNKLHHLTEEPNWIVKRLRSLGWLAILGAAVLIGVGAQILRETVDSSALAWLLTIGSLVVYIALFATTYKFLPSTDQSWKDVLPGALVAGFGFMVLNLLGTTYLAQGEGTRNDTFGTFAAAATLLIASYLLAQLTLLSAEVNLVLAERRNLRLRSSLRDGMEGEVS